MPTKTTNQVIKPVYHILAVVIPFTFFAILNGLGIVNANTQVPSTVSGLIDFLMSTRSIFIMLFVALLLASLVAKFKADYTWRSRFRKGFFFVMALFTGKLYTWAGFFFAWGITAPYVPYLAKLPLPFAYGGLSLVLGWLSWVLARSSAIALWKRN